MEGNGSHLVQLGHDRWFHCTNSQEDGSCGQSENQVRLHPITPILHPFHQGLVLKILQPHWTALSRDQVFKHMRLWGGFPHSESNVGPSMSEPMASCSHSMQAASMPDILTLHHLPPSFLTGGRGKRAGAVPRDLLAD